MNRQQRMKLIDAQLRAYTIGTIENINDQWVFFDGETEEASLLDEYLHQEIEFLRNEKWVKGILFEEGKIGLADEVILLQDQDEVRIRKHLVYSLERLLEELHHEVVLQFIKTLNSLKFSIYDCIYCYNHMTFLHKTEQKNGVNFLIFDNQELICTVQHHFSYHEKVNDRFEFTLNNGKRMIVEKLSG